MNFSRALEEMKAGFRLAREGWNGKGMWVAMWSPSPNGEPVDVPFLIMSTAQGTTVPWTPSATDLFAEDWRNVSPEPAVMRRALDGALGASSKPMLTLTFVLQRAGEWHEAAFAGHELLAPIAAQRELTSFRQALDGAPLSTRSRAGFGRALRYALESLSERLMGHD